MDYHFVDILGWQRRKADEPTVHYLLQIEEAIHRDRGDPLNHKDPESLNLQGRRGGIPMRDQLHGENIDHFPWTGLQEQVRQISLICHLKHKCQKRITDRLDRAYWLSWGNR